MSYTSSGKALYPYCADKPRSIALQCNEHVSGQPKQHYNGVANTILLTPLASPEAKNWIKMNEGNNGGFLQVKSFGVLTWHPGCVLQNVCKSWMHNYKNMFYFFIQLPP